MKRVRAASALFALLVWVLVAAPRQASSVRDHLEFGWKHVLEPVGEIRREQYGPDFQAAIERIAAEIPPRAEYRLVASRNPGCEPMWVRAALAPRVPRSLGPESALRRQELEALLAQSPRVFVVGCSGGAPALLSADTLPGSVAR